MTFLVSFLVEGSQKVTKCISTFISRRHQNIVINEKCGSNSTARKRNVLDRSKYAF